MQIGIPRELAAGEARVAATPETIKRLIGLGHTVSVEFNAGALASIPDSAYQAVGAQMVSAQAVWQSEVILKVRSLLESELMHCTAGRVVIGMLNPFDAEGLNRLAACGLTAFALEAVPRTTRAQSMDVLSSQANIAGYKAVLMAANDYSRLFPMMMSAAGTIKAARVVVLGAGVAGLQAIATAKRLGAVVEASDVRPAVKEQVESLGAKFIDVPYETDEERAAAQGVGGYARPMPQSWLARQREAVAARVAQADVVITTALIPGRAAPTLVTQAMVESMRPGSVIVDLAAVQGGNCALTKVDTVVSHQGVTIVGHSNIPATVAADASALYARNVLDFLKLIINKEGQLHIDLEDDIVKACLVVQNGQVCRF